MQARREEEAIIGAGHREQGPGCRRWDFRCCGRNRADAGAQLGEIRGFARPHSTTKRPVFVGEGRKIGLLPHEVRFYRRSLHVVSTQSLKGPWSLPWVRSWHLFVHPSDFPLKRTMNIRESSFDATTAHNAVFRSYLFSIANYPMDFAPRRACSGPRHAPAPITRAVF